MQRASLPLVGRDEGWGCGAMFPASRMPRHHGMDPRVKPEDDGAELDAWRETAESSAHGHLSSVIPVLVTGIHS